MAVLASPDVGVRRRALLKTYKSKEPVMLSGAKHLWLFPPAAMHANQKRSEILRCAQNDKTIYEMAFSHFR